MLAFDTEANKLVYRLVSKKSNNELALAYTYLDARTGEWLDASTGEPTQLPRP